MIKFKEGQVYISGESDFYWWTEGKEYPVTSDARGDLAIKNDVGSFWYEDEINCLQQKFKLKEEKQMLKFEEGQTYICTKSPCHRWTEGKEYPVINNNFYRLGIKDNTGRFWYENEINELPHKFILKEEPQTSDLIDNQSHYKNQGIEPIALMKANFSQEEFAGFLQGNVLKYMLRYKDKNGLEDLKKAKTYLTWLIEELDDDGIRRSVS